MNGLSFYKIYKPLQLHFTTNYDVFKYSGKSRGVTEATFADRNDISLFERFGYHHSNKREAGKFVLANFIYNDLNWLYSDDYDYSKEVFFKWQTINAGLTNTFKNDINVLSETIKAKKVASVEALFVRTTNGNHAPIVQLFLHHRIAKETVCIIDNIVPCISRWSRMHSNDPLVTSELFKMKKYTPFISAKFTEEQSVMFKQFVKECKN